MVETTLPEPRGPEPDDPQAAAPGDAMYCPRCHHLLFMRQRDGIQIDVCSGCRGVWLDRGELEKLLARAQDEWLRDWMGNPV